MTPEEIAALKARHGEVYVIELGETEIAVRHPSRAEKARTAALLEFEERRARRRGRMRACVDLREAERLFRACVVHPALHELDALLEAQPGALVPLLKAFGDVAAR